MTSERADERPDEGQIQRQPSPRRSLASKPPQDDAEDELAYRRLRRSIGNEPEEVVTATDFIAPVNVNPLGFGFRLSRPDRFLCPFV